MYSKLCVNVPLTPGTLYSCSLPCNQNERKPKHYTRDPRFEATLQEFLQELRGDLEAKLLFFFLTAISRVFHTLTCYSASCSVMSDAATPGCPWGLLQARILEWSAMPLNVTESSPVSACRQSLSAEYEDAEVGSRFAEIAQAGSPCCGHRLSAEPTQDRVWLAFHPPSLSS